MVQPPITEPPPTPQASSHSRDAPPLWERPERCRDRVVYSLRGTAVGRIHRVVFAPDDQRDAFFVLLLGSVARLGNDARAVPARLVAEIGDERLQLLCDEEAVRTAPLHVEGQRCSCGPWFARVRSHFAGFAAVSPPTGKPPHSSSP